MLKYRESVGTVFSGEKAEIEIMISVGKIYSAWECEVSYNVISLNLLNLYKSQYLNIPLVNGLNAVEGVYLD